LLERSQNREKIWPEVGWIQLIAAG